MRKLVLLFAVFIATSVGAQDPGSMASRPLCPSNLPNCTGTADNYFVRANEPTTGTIQYHNVKTTTSNPSQVIRKSTADALAGSGTVGICLFNCGTTGNAIIIYHGIASCSFDGATTANDFVGLSDTQDGKCKDIGAVKPMKDRIVGRVLSTNGSGGVYEVLLAGLGLRGQIDIPTSSTGKILRDDGTWVTDQTGSGTTPTGTGFRHVTAGVEDAAASLPTKSDVGLGNADNTSDANKPVSTATQSALDNKAASSHGHVIADTTSLQTTLDGKALASHAHVEADVTNLVTDLANKAALSHAHTQADVTGLVTDLAAKQPLDADLTAIAALACPDGQIPKKAAGVWTCAADNTGGGGGGNVLNAVRVTANVANSTTTFADVTGLTMAVAATTNYSFSCELSYTSAATTTALQLSINGPASPTAMRYSVFTNTTATAKHSASQSAYDTVTNPGTSLGATAVPVRIVGTLENGSNAGTLAIRLRSEVATSAVTVLRGSFCTFVTY